ncbi:MAG TPA: hypothetical protein VMJ10_14730 [Kofleriaceae bacterium]|nr:hypothetical protein [Kofleriaceae bacterium]
MYPVFAPMFERGRYLRFLHPYRSGGTPDPDVFEALAVADEHAHSTATLTEDLCTLLSDRNWRPNLVGGVVLVRTRMSNAAILEALWSAIDRPSWVSPQLAVAASKIDPEFTAKAHTRIRAASAKTANALAALVDLDDRVPDVDDGAGIALTWRAAMTQQYCDRRSR